MIDDKKISAFKESKVETAIEKATVFYTAQ